MLFILNRPEHFFYKKKKKSTHWYTVHTLASMAILLTAFFYCCMIRKWTRIPHRYLGTYFGGFSNYNFSQLDSVSFHYFALYCTKSVQYIGFIRAFNIIKSDLKALIGSPRVLYLSILYTKSRKIVPLRSSLANESIPNFWQNTLTKIERSPPSQEGEKLIGHYYSRWEEKADRTSL